MGQILDESDFYPFGGERVITASTGNPYLFTGKERDPESGLDFFGARYFSSQFARFLQPDEFTGGPVDAFSSNDAAPPGALPYADITKPQSLNKYTYTYNNPLNFVDPNGHCVVDGEKHGWLWCLGHNLGITKTQKERADQARQDLSNMKNFTINGQTPQDFAQNATDQQVLAAKRAVTEFMVGKALESFNPCPPGMTCGVIPLPLGRGSTGRVVPTSLKEQLALEEAMSKPAAGKPLTNVVMADKRWPASQGWVKMEQNINGVKIHYVMNTITGAVDDFKFVP
jgi:RHS repeat-associated protein